MTLLQSLYTHHCSLEGIKEILRHRHLQTHLHCERVVLLADAFGKACALEKSEHEKLLYSAVFHDIGKVGIPDDILKHNGDLDEEQRAVMQLHSSMGEAIVRLMQLAHGEEIADHVRHHHEHFDGSGYPDGLKGDRIPLIARILTILDSYDALREIRPYRRALNHADAVAILRNESGTKHDPDLLDRFLMMADIEGIEEHYEKGIIF
jgi:HD-GYP domain-containing protein (c-di-GMP phosphodiesterase class II)